MFNQIAEWLGAIAVVSLLASSLLFVFLFAHYRLERRLDDRQSREMAKIERFRQSLIEQHSKH